MAYIYQADIYCDDCGEAIQRRITEEGKAPADPNNEYSFDSDDFPKHVGNDEESDCPDHCACSAECINAITLFSGFKVGEIIGELTLEGVDYIETAICEANYYKKVHGQDSNEVVNFWYDEYTAKGYDFQVAPI